MSILHRNAPDPSIEPAESRDGGPALERTGHAKLWILVSIVVLVGIGIAASSMLGQSVVFYRTPTEVASAPGQHVRLAGTLVAASVVTDKAAGSTSFTLTDGTTRIPVIYAGSASTALTTAAQPGTQLVAEGSLGTDGVFRSDVLIAKCPSKFAAGGGSNANGQ
jgi:cytochrome c-type biogenesis protein CcmE